MQTFLVLRAACAGVTNSLNIYQYLLTRRKACLLAGKYIGKQGGNGLQVILQMTCR
jgi:hypothetical protein